MYFYKTGVVDVRGLVPYCVGTAPLAADSSVGSAEERKIRNRGLRRFVRKYIWQKIIFQLVVKPALRLWKQPSTW